MVDDDTWAITHLIVTTSNWWGGHRVLVAPRWIKDVSWSGPRSLSIGLARASMIRLRMSLPHNSMDRVNREPRAGT